jgi:transcriptional regulator GlxA family with amidase domain
MNVANSRGSESQPSIDKHNVGILLFDGVEVLDFAGPFEVFSRTRLVPGVESRRSDATAPFRVFTVARKAEPVTATGDLQLIPRYSFETCPTIDFVVIPGGYGTRALLNDKETLDWIRTTAAAAKRVTSVCTGSLLLAQAGLLDGRCATTHWGALALLQEISDSRGAAISVQRDLRFVDDGIITSAGVSAGIDMALHVVEQMCGGSVAAETAHYMDYKGFACG